MGALALTGGEKTRTENFPQWPIFDETDRKALLDVLESGKWWAGQGTRCEEFARKFAEFHDADYGLTLTNGTHTLEIALAALGIGPGDEVIIPAYTFIATATAVLDANAVPVIVDVDPSTYCMDPDKLEQAITDSTKAVIPVHLAGNVANMKMIIEIARKHDLLVIEDCAHAHGAVWEGRRAGSIGNIGSFSFQASKTLTGGEGGILITNDEDLIEQCYSVSDCGRTRRVTTYTHSYDHVRLGTNCRMTEFQAALLLSQMKRLPSQLEVRNRNALELNKSLGQIPGIRPQKRDECCTTQGYYVYMFRFDANEFAGISRDRFVETLKAEGIPVQPTYPAVHKTSVFQAGSFKGKDCPLNCHHYKGSQRDYKSLTFPVAERIASNCVCLPQYVLLDDNVQSIVDAIVKIQDNAYELLKL